MGNELRYDRIMKRLEDGAPYGVIAQEFGTTVGTIRAYDRVRTGDRTRRGARTSHAVYEMPGGKKELSEDEIRRIRVLRAEGVPIAKIGLMLHRDRKTVSAALKRLGVESPKRTRNRIQEACHDKIIEAYMSGVGGPVRIAETLSGVTPAMVANVLTKYVYKKGGSGNGDQTDDGDGTGSADAR